MGAGQEFSKHGLGAVNATARRHFVDAQDVCDFTVPDFVHVVESERDSVLLGEFSNALKDHIGIRGAVGRRNGRRGDGVNRHGGEAGSCEFFCRVDGNAVQPFTESMRLAKAGESPVGPDKDFLGHVFGRVPVAGVEAGQGEYHVLMVRDQAGKCLFIAFEGSSNQFCCILG